MQNDIEEYTRVYKHVASQIRSSPDFLMQLKKQKEPKMNDVKSKSKACVEVLGHRVEKYALMKSLTQT